MAFTGNLYDYERWQEFDYYVSSTGGVVNESLSSPNGKRWKLNEVRIKFSSAFASVEDFVVKISSILGSYYDQKLVSVALNGVLNYLNQFENGIHLSASDTLNVTMSAAAGVNDLGIQLIGWAVSG